VQRFTRGTALVRDSTLEAPLPLFLFSSPPLFLFSSSPLLLSSSPLLLFFLLSSSLLGCRYLQISATVPFKTPLVARTNAL